MSKFERLSTPAVTKEQKAFLDELRDRTGTSHAAHIRALIQKDMDLKSKQESSVRFSFGNLPMDIVHALIGSSLFNKADVLFYVDHDGQLESIDGIGPASVAIINNWLEA